MPSLSSPERLAEELSEWSRAGMTYAISYFADTAYDTTGLELYAREVMPALSV